MNTNGVKDAVKKTMLATLAVATLATSSTVMGTQDAQAGSRDFWAGAAAGVVTGAIVGAHHRRYREPDVVYVERRPRTVYVERHSNYDRHVRWCYANYRSYDEYSDSFKPFRGPRRRCNSPWN